MVFRGPRALATDYDLGGWWVAWPPSRDGVQVDVGQETRPSLRGVMSHQTS